MTKADHSQSTGDRQVLQGLALLTALFFIVLIVSVFAYQAGMQNSPSDRLGTRTIQETIEHCSAKTKNDLAECVYTTAIGDATRLREYQDLNAQEWMAYWAGVLAILTLMSAIVSLVALKFLYDTFRETNRATSQMIKQNELQEATNRPMLQFDSLEISKLWSQEKSALEPDDRSILMHYGVGCTNIGRLPAIDAYIQIDICCVQWLEDSQTRVQSEWQVVEDNLNLSTNRAFKLACDRLDPKTLVPGAQLKTEGGTTSINSLELDRGPLHLDTIFVIASAFYRSPLGGGWLQSNMVWKVYGRPKSFKGIRLDIPYEFVTDNLEMGQLNFFAPIIGQPYIGSEDPEG